MNKLTTFLEQYGLISLEKQEKLAHMIGEHLFQLDLDRGTVSFGDRELPFQALGTESDNTLTWLWAWADEQTEMPEDLISTSLALKDWGAQEGLQEFVMPAVDLDKADGHLISLIASAVCKASCFYRDAYEGGALFILLFDKMIDGRASFDLSGLTKQFLEMISRYEFNHRNALLSYLTLKGLTPQQGISRVACLLTTGELLSAEFDKAGGLTLLNGEVVTG